MDEKGTTTTPAVALIPPLGGLLGKKNYLPCMPCVHAECVDDEVVGRVATPLTKGNIMRSSIIKSNVQVHGPKFAVACEVRRFKRMGCSPERALNLALQLVFGRVVF